MDTIAFRTLGCKVNQAETASLKRLFEEAGYKAVSFSQPADVYVINTCTVTHLGDRKSRQAVRRARRQNPEAVIVVTGCYAQVSPEEVLELPEVNLVVGTHGRERLPELVREARQKRLNCVLPLEQKTSFEPVPSAQNSRTRAFLKVQEGCRQFCSYCIVPYARGPLYSMPPKLAVAEAEKLAAAGYRELVLTGVHLGSYGVDLEEKPTLTDLLQLMIAVDGIERIRLSSIEPTEITTELIECLLHNRKICRHLHIPLQSGDDEILAKMNRKYSAGEYYSLVRLLREKVPGIALTTDVMVGFPGESGEHFQRTFEMVKRCAFSRLHVFKYSPRRGTPAADFPNQVPDDVKNDRSDRLIDLGDALAASYRAGFIGKTVEVLFETKSGGGTLTGTTEHYLRVRAAAPPYLLGKTAKVLVLSGEKEETLWGTLA